MTQQTLPEETDSESPPSAFGRLRREITQHRTAYAVLGLSVLGGVAIAPQIFPDATPLQGGFGGLCLGAWAALGSSAGKFFGD